LDDFLALFLIKVAIPVAGGSILASWPKLRAVTAGIRARIDWQLLRWIALFLYIGFYVAYVTVPYYGSGIHLMSTSQIYQANNEYNLAEWYPLFKGAGYVCRSDAYGAAAGLYLFFPILTIPLFASALWRLPTDWRSSSSVGRLWRVAFSILIVVLIALYFHPSSSHIGEWLWD
jgi:hypothetical protein